MLLTICKQNKIKRTEYGETMLFFILFWLINILNNELLKLTKFSQMRGRRMNLNGMEEVDK